MHFVRMVCEGDTSGGEWVGSERILHSPPLSIPCRMWGCQAVPWYLTYILDEFLVLEAKRCLVLVVPRMPGHLYQVSVEVM